MAKRPFLLALLLVGLAGCTGSESQLGQKDEATLKNNFTRGLTKEEMSQMGKSKDKAPKDKL